MKNIPTCSKLIYHRSYDFEKITMSPPSKAKLKPTVQRRILLLLSDHMDKIDDFEVPETITQKGIGRRIGLRQTHVSRALTELKREGLIESRSAHIKEVGRKKKSYFLTMKGQKDMIRYCEDISSRNVPLRDNEGQLKLVTLETAKDLISRSAAKRISYHSLFSDHYDGNEFKMESYMNGTDIKDAPSSKDLFGRDKEISEIQNHLEDTRCRFISITGIAGMGKTALLGAISTMPEHDTISFITITEWTTPEKLMLDWAKVLSQRNRICLFDHMNGTAKDDLATSIEMLGKDLSCSQSIIILDDLHKARKEIIMMLSSLKDMLNDETDVKFITGSRQRPEFYGKRDIMISKKVHEIKLMNLDRESSTRMLRSKGLEKVQVERAYSSFKGHPLALEMYSISPSDIELEGSMDFDSYIMEEVLYKLSREEIAALKLASTYLKPVSLEGLLLIEGIDQATINDLCNKLLLNTLRDRRYSAHDSIRSVIRNSMTNSEYQEFLDAALLFLSERGSEEDILHKLILLRDADRTEELNKLVIEEGEMLLLQGHSIVLDIVRTIDINGLSRTKRIEYHILRSYFTPGKKRNDPSWKQLEKALTICDEILKEAKDRKMRRRTTKQVSRILYRRAEISKAQGRSDDIIKEYRKSLSYNRKYGGPEGIGKALNNLAIAYRDQGDLDKALELLDEAYILFENKGDLTSCSIIEVNIAEIYMERRDRSSAFKHLKRVEEIPLNVQSISGNLHMKIGILYKGLDRHIKAERHLLRAYDSFLSSKKPDLMMETLSILYSIEKLERESRRSYLIKANEILISDRWDLSIKTKLHYILDVMDFKESRSLRNLKDPIIDELADPRMIKRTIKVIGQLRSTCKDIDLFIRLMDTIRLKADENGIQEGSIILEIWTAELLIKKGEITKAKGILEQTKIRAKKSGFSKAMVMIDSLGNG